VVETYTMVTPSHFRPWQFLSLVVTVLPLLGTSLEGRQLLEARLMDSGIELRFDDGTATVRGLSAHAFEYEFTPVGEENVPSAAVARPGVYIEVEAETTPTGYRLNAGQITAVIDREPFKLHYERHGRELLAERGGYFDEGMHRGFRFGLRAGEKLLGGGERVLGMDRRGQRLVLYNKPSYGYETEAPLMYYSMPVVISSDRYMLIFDNGARGYMDLGAARDDLLEVAAEGGRRAYIVVAGNSWTQLVSAFTEVTGLQPLPPRWALGNISSRMGYRSQAEVEWVADGYAVKDIPVDAMVLDLYWFGPGLFGHMGNLAWDYDAFPRPQAMMQRLREQGIKTILITEPFVLKTSANFDAVVEQGLVGTTADGEPYIYDFYFGTTTLLDIFKPETREWFWDFYRRKTESGVAGWWGDLGEPEVHPDGLHHVAGRAPEVHNLYGHEWASLVAEGYARDFPEQRPLILMRAGFVGSQRHGMIPWSGDVNRTWGGLQPQVEIALQMGMQGLGYMHSDLGGFAGNYHDAELYTRWMQYGAFQPVYRPHAQEEIAPEPIFWDHATLQNVRPFIKLRYALTPYNYTLAWHNSTSGLPLMRPLFYVDPDPALLTRSDGYLWGDAFLVYPVVHPEQEQMEVYFPVGTAWFDFFTGERYEGGTSATVETPLERLPVFVRAGAFVPMIPPVQSLDFYPNDQNIFHYWHDEAVRFSSYELYEDDGMTRDAAALGLAEISRLTASMDAEGHQLTLQFQRGGSEFAGRAESKNLDWRIHQLAAELDSVAVDGEVVHSWQWDADERSLSVPAVTIGNVHTVVISLPE
jgi:oligosaccharide 4-alpha-D-glucosyltransferase